MKPLPKSDLPTPANKNEALFESLIRTAVNAPQQQITARQIDGPVPLSYSQQRLWFLDQFEPGNTTYNVFRALRLKGQISPPIMETSLNEIVRRHEALRTVFSVVDGQPVQVIMPSLTLSLPVIDLSDLAESEQEAQVRKLITQESKRIFDLSQGPLMQVTLLRLAEEEQILLVVIHHTITDGRSIGIIFQELTALYEAFSLGKRSPLAEPPIQYADYALWQREWLQGEALETQLVYWKQRLTGQPPVLNLPTDHPRPATQTFQGARQSITISKAVTTGLKEMGQKEGVTLFMTLLAAFKTLLYRYSGQEDINVGSPVSNRNRAEILETIGPFINTLVFRTDLSGNPSFQELLTRVRETALGAYAHQDLPFEKLVEELQPTRDLSLPPLFQVLFNMHNFAGHSPELLGLSVEQLSPPEPDTEFDITLYAIERKEEIHLELIYNTDLFDASTIIRMLGHFQNLLKGIAANPDQPLKDLPLLTETERHQLLVEWNNTDQEYPKDKCIHELFEAQEERSPDAVAVVFEDEKLTYRQLNMRANQLAHYLKKQGVGPEVLVGIYMERSSEMVVGLLGILKAGGAYVPLDPTYPSERLAFMIEDAEVSVLLTQEKLVTELPDHQAQVICLDSDWEEEIAQENEQNPGRAAMTENLAYVIYTSGSTGKPKGVQISHRALTNFLFAMRQQPGLTEQDKLFAVTTLSFDIAALEIYLPIMIGACVEIASPEVATDGILLAERLATSGATVMQATPATWQLLIKSGWQGNDQLKVLCGGEALSRNLADELLERSESLWNLYGPTETTIWSAAYKVEAKGGLVSIGHPIANTQIYLLDDQLQPLPIGVPGELYIGGDGLARGYLNRPELVAERFVRNPFNHGNGDRLYRTGDLARYLPDGNIEYIGRIDHQVKVRGYRIELGEIETVLGQHPDVQEIAVIVREDIPDDKRLVAYIVPSKDATLAINELRGFLKQTLPDYMIPSAFVMLEKLPLTPNGKVDRKVLPAPDQTRPDLENRFVAPRTEVERKMAQIWAEILGLEQVGVQDDFFDLGGHSLLATQVVFRLADTFQIKIPLRTLFETPTIAGLAKYIETISRILTQQTSPEAKPDNREEIVL